MPGSPGDQSRKLKRLGREAILQGLPVPTNEPPWIGAGLLMLERLRAAAPAAGASEAAVIALDLLEATMARRTSRQPIECARGCSFCCTTVVSITAPEAFRLARWLSQNAATLPPALAPAAIIERADERAGATLPELLRRRLPCVLLIDNACGAYTARPSNCRRLLSSSKAACKADFEGVPTRIPMVEEAMQKGAHVRALLLAAVAAAGLPTTGYELSQALAIALREPQAEQRWLAGEDVFAGAKLQQDLGPMQSAVDHWRTRLKRFA